MEPVEYVFRIDAFTPDTLPMLRLAQYLAELAKLIGHEEHTHFVRVDEGSAQLVHKVDAVDAPKVETRLDNVRLGDAPTDALKAKKALEEMLANDNAVATLTAANSGRVVVPFVGRNRLKPLTFPPFREDTAIEGQIVNIGGKDSTAHATLQDGDIFHTSISMKRELAKELAPLLYGPVVRLHGSGRFERLPGGVWKMTEFRVERHEKLDAKPISEILDNLRELPDNALMEERVYFQIEELRQDEGDVE